MHPSSKTALRSDCTEIGVAYSEGARVYFSLSINRSYSILCTEGARGVQTPAEVNLEIATRRETEERRNFVVIVEGTLRWLDKYRSQLADPDAVIYVAPEPVLSALGVTIIDAGWKPGDEPLDTPEAWIASVGSGEPTETSADEFGFPEDSLENEVRSAPQDLLGEMSRAAGQEERVGRCYELAGRWVSSHPTATLVHGSIQGFDNPRIDHAWAVTAEGAIYEPIGDRAWDRAEFEALFNPQEDHRYVASQVWETSLQSGHWGPWESSTAPLEVFQAILQRATPPKPLPEASVAPVVRPETAEPTSVPVVASEPSVAPTLIPKTVRRTPTGSVPTLPEELRPTGTSDDNGPLFDPAALDPDFADPAAEFSEAVSAGLVAGAEVEEAGTGIHGVVASVSERTATVRFQDEEDDSIVPLSELRLIGEEEPPPDLDTVEMEEEEAEWELPASGETISEEDDDTLFLI